MFVTEKNIRRGLLISALAFCLIGMMTASAQAWTRSACLKCGCQYGRSCDANSCWVECRCPLGPKDACVGRSATATSVSMGQINKTDKGTTYRLPEAAATQSAPAKSAK